MSSIDDMMTANNDDGMTPMKKDEDSSEEEGLTVLYASTRTLFWDSFSMYHHHRHVNNNNNNDNSKRSSSSSNPFHHYHPDGSWARGDLGKLVVAMEFIQLQGDSFTAAAGLSSSPSTADGGLEAMVSPTSRILSSPTPIRDRGRRQRVLEQIHLTLWSNHYPSLPSMFSTRNMNLHYQPPTTTATSSTMESHLNIYTNPIMGTYCLLIHTQHEMDQRQNLQKQQQQHSQHFSFPHHQQQQQQQQRTVSSKHSAEVKRLLQELQERFYHYNDQHQHHHHHHPQSENLVSMTSLSLEYGVSGAIQGILYLRECLLAPRLFTSHVTRYSVKMLQALASLPTIWPSSLPLGMARGLVGILYSLLACSSHDWTNIDPYLYDNNIRNVFVNTTNNKSSSSSSSLSLVREFVDQLWSDVASSLNMMTSSSNPDDMNKPTHKLLHHLQWSNGSTGLVCLLIRASQVFETDSYIEHAEVLCEHIWKQYHSQRHEMNKKDDSEHNHSSLSSSSFGLSNGIAGIAMGMILLARHYPLGHSLRTKWEQKADILLHDAVRDWHASTTLSGTFSGATTGSSSPCYGIWDGLGGLLSVLFFRFHLLQPTEFPMFPRASQPIVKSSKPSLQEQTSVLPTPVSGRRQTETEEPDVPLFRKVSTKRTPPNIQDVWTASKTTLPIQKRHNLVVDTTTASPYPLVSRYSHTTTIQNSASSSRGGGRRRTTTSASISISSSSSSKASNVSAIRPIRMTRATQLRMKHTKNRGPAETTTVKQPSQSNAPVLAQDETIVVPPRSDVAVQLFSSNDIPLKPAIEIDSKTTIKQPSESTTPVLAQDDETNVVPQRSDVAVQLFSSNDIPSKPVIENDSTTTFKKPSQSTPPVLAQQDETNKPPRSDVAVQLFSSNGIHRKPAFEIDSKMQERKIQERKMKLEAERKAQLLQAKESRRRRDELAKIKTDLLKAERKLLLSSTPRTTTDEDSAIRGYMIQKPQRPAVEKKHRSRIQTFSHRKVDPTLSHRKVDPTLSHRKVEKADRHEDVKTTVKDLEETPVRNEKEVPKISKESQSRRLEQSKRVITAKPPDLPKLDSARAVRRGNSDDKKKQVVNSNERLPPKRSDQTPPSSNRLSNKAPLKRNHDHKALKVHPSDPLLPSPKVLVPDTPVDSSKNLSIDVTSEHPSPTVAIEIADAVPQQEKTSDSDVPIQADVPKSVMDPSKEDSPVVVHSGSAVPSSSTPPREALDSSQNLVRPASTKEETISDVTSAFPMDVMSPPLSLQVDDEFLPSKENPRTLFGVNLSDDEDEDFDAINAIFAEAESTLESHLAAILGSPEEDTKEVEELHDLDVSAMEYHSFHEEDTSPIVSDALRSQTDEVDQTHDKPTDRPKDDGSRVNLAINDETATLDQGLNIVQSIADVQEKQASDVTPLSSGGGALDGIVPSNDDGKGGDRLTHTGIIPTSTSSGIRDSGSSKGSEQRIDESSPVAETEHPITIDQPCENSVASDADEKNLVGKVQGDNVPMLQLVQQLGALQLNVDSQQLMKEPRYSSATEPSTSQDRNAIPDLPSAVEPPTRSEEFRIDVSTTSVAIKSDDRPVTMGSIEPLLEDATQVGQDSAKEQPLQLTPTGALEQFSLVDQESMSAIHATNDLSTVIEALQVNGSSKWAGLELGSKSNTMQGIVAEPSERNEPLPLVEGSLLLCDLSEIEASVVDDQRSIHDQPSEAEPPTPLEQPSVNGSLPNIESKVHDPVENSQSSPYALGEIPISLKGLSEEDDDLDDDFARMTSLFEEADNQLEAELEAILGPSSDRKILDVRSTERDEEDEDLESSIVDEDVFASPNIREKEMKPKASVLSSSKGKFATSGSSTRTDVANFAGGKLRRRGKVSPGN